MKNEQLEIRQNEPSDILKLIGIAATDATISVEKMERLFALQERWENRNAAQQFQSAMIAARQEMPEITKDAQGQNSKFAPLEKIDRVVYPIYTKNGFSLQWSEVPHETPGWTRIKCVVLHSGGHREEHFLAGPMDDKGPKGLANKTGIQGMGSTWSYLQRRLLAMIFNIRIVGEDNDGKKQSASQPGAAKLTPEQVESEARKDIMSKLWNLLIDVRGSAAKWDTAAEWLRQNSIIGKTQRVSDLTSEQLSEVYDKSSIQLSLNNGK